MTFVINIIIYACPGGALMHDKGSHQNYTMRQGHTAARSRCELVCRNYQGLRGLNQAASA